MGLCKFYMEGYCRYGNQCRFEHADTYENYEHRRTNYDRPSGRSVLKASVTIPREEHQFNQQVFQGSQQIKATLNQKYSIHDVLQVVVKEVFQAEKSNQWPLSCYSPARDLPNIPDLVDYSPEELRWECYIAIHNGRLPVCQAIVQQLQANAAKVNSKLKKKDTAYPIIENWLREVEAARLQSQETESSFGNSSSVAFSVTSSNQSNPQPVEFSFSLPQQQINLALQQQSVSSSMQQQTTMGFPQQTTMGFQQQTSMGFQEQPASGNIFGGSQMKVQPTYSSFVDNSAYSLAEELNESELKAFREHFVFGCIPTKPPPKEMCG